MPALFTPVVYRSNLFLELRLSEENKETENWYCDGGLWRYVGKTLIRVSMEKLRNALMVLSANPDLFESVRIGAEIDCPDFDGTVAYPQVQITPKNRFSLFGLSAVFTDDRTGAVFGFDLEAYLPDGYGFDELYFYLKSL